jgi:hypothetical protein
MIGKPVAGSDAGRMACGMHRRQQMGAALGTAMVATLGAIAGVKPIQMT